MNPVIIRHFQILMDKNMPKKNGKPTLNIKSPLLLPLPPLPPPGPTLSAPIEPQQRIQPNFFNPAADVLPNGLLPITSFNLNQINNRDPDQSRSNNTPIEDAIEDKLISAAKEKVIEKIVNKKINTIYGLATNIQSNISENPDPNHPNVELASRVFFDLASGEILPPYSRDISEIASVIGAETSKILQKQKEQITDDLNQIKTTIKEAPDFSIRDGIELNRLQDLESHYTDLETFCATLQIPVQLYGYLKEGFVKGVVGIYDTLTGVNIPVKKPESQPVLLPLNESSLPHLEISVDLSKLSNSEIEKQLQIMKNPELRRDMQNIGVDIRQIEQNFVSLLKVDQKNTHPLGPVTTPHSEANTFEIQKTINLSGSAEVNNPNTKKTQNETQHQSSLILPTPKPTNTKQVGIGNIEVSPTYFQGSPAARVSINNNNNDVALNGVVGLNGLGVVAKVAFDTISLSTVAAGGAVALVVGSGLYTGYMKLRHGYKEAPTLPETELNKLISCFEKKHNHNFESSCRAQLIKLMQDAHKNAYQIRVNDPRRIIRRKNPLHRGYSLLSGKGLKEAKSITQKSLRERERLEENFYSLITESFEKTNKTIDKTTESTPEEKNDNLTTEELKKILRSELLRSENNCGRPDTGFSLGSITNQFSSYMPFVPPLLENVNRLVGSALHAKSVTRQYEFYQKSAALKAEHTRVSPEIETHESNQYELSTADINKSVFRY